MIIIIRVIFYVNITVHNGANPFIFRGYSINNRYIFIDRSDSLPKVIEVEQGVNPASAQSDPSSRKYREYQTTYPDDPALITVSYFIYIDFY